MKHGICTRVEGGTVTIRSREEADAYVVEVEDDGVGFDPEELEQRQAWGGAEHKYTHIGLANIGSGWRSWPAVPLRLQASRGREPW